MQLLGLPSKLRSPNAKFAAPTATAEKPLKEGSGGDLGEVEHLNVAVQVFFFCPCQADVLNIQHNFLLQHYPVHDPLPTYVFDH
jgi:hypothetical protein